MPGQQDEIKREGDMPPQMKPKQPLFERVLFGIDRNYDEPIRPKAKTYEPPRQFLFERAFFGPDTVFPTTKQVPPPAPEIKMPKQPETVASFKNNVEIYKDKKGVPVPLYDFMKDNGGK